MRGFFLCLIPPPDGCRFQLSSLQASCAHRQGRISYAVVRVLAGAAIFLALEPPALQGGAFQHAYAAGRGRALAGLW